MKKLLGVLAAGVALALCGALPAAAQEGGAATAETAAAAGFTAAEADPAVVAAMGYTADDAAGYPFTVYSSFSGDALLAYGWPEGAQGETPAWYSLDDASGSWVLYAEDTLMEEVTAQYYAAYPEEQPEGLIAEDCTTTEEPLDSFEAQTGVGTINLVLTGRYHQDVAYTMLAMANEMRTTGNNWYWNKTNDDYEYGATTPLVWDSDLEKVAMQRAMEIAVRYSHTRPDERSWITAYSDNNYRYSYAGENIAVGYSSAQSVFTAWMEADKDYSGQGHRRNILATGAKATGMACVEANGRRYWVQEFSGARQGSETPSNEAGDFTKTLSVDATILKLVSTDPASFAVQAGGSTALPESITCTFRVAENNWGATLPGEPFTNLSWSSSDSSIAKITGGKIVGVANGSTTVTAVIGACTFKIPVAVTTDMSKAAVTLSASSFEFYYYSNTSSNIAAVQTPTVESVVLNGKALTADTDYTVKYADANSAKPGSYSLTITGNGNYSGSITKSYTITKGDISKAEVAVSSRYIYKYDGKAKTPVFTVTYKERKLDSYDYDVSYSPNNINAGTVTIILTGKDNFTGTNNSATFTIQAATTSGTTGGTTSGTTTGGTTGGTTDTTGVEGFVDRLYSVCLGRAADAAGKANWVGQLTSYQISGTKAAYGFIFSQEFTNMNYSNADYVEHLYAAFMGRASDEAGKADWVGKLAAGTSREEVFNGFANSVEFDNICKSYGIVSKDIETFVTRLYSVCLDRQPDSAGLADWAGRLRSGAVSGKAAASGFVFSAEFTGKNYSNSDYVEHLYAAFMGRAGDTSGKAYWVGKLAAGTSRETVFNGFADSAEFDEICASYGIVRG